MKIFKIILMVAIANLFALSNAISGNYKGPDLSGEKVVISNLA